MALPSRERPDDEQIWQLVREHAERCRIEQRPLYTLSRGVANLIVEVGEHRIRRESAEGTTQSAHIDRHHVLEVWHELLAQGYSATTGKPRVFAHVLLHDALPDCVHALGNRLVLYDMPTPPRPAATREAWLGYRLGAGFGGGEGALHRAIRLFIFESPDLALRDLAGGPFTSIATEYTLETRDRVDVVVRDAAGRTVLIEVKPWVCDDELYGQLRDERRIALARAPWAQALKYRTQWQVLYGTSLEQLRCVVAAPTRPPRLAAAMQDSHGVESTAVCLADELR